MSANLLDGLTLWLMNGTTAESDGTWHHAARTEADGHQDWLIWRIPDQAALTTNQTYHVGLSVKGATANSKYLRAIIGSKDAAGYDKWQSTPFIAVGTSWGRAEATIVVPSGRTPRSLFVAAYGTCPETWMASPTLSLGSPVCLASSAHTPYATQDHVRSEYATKAALKVTSDAVTAEVTERGKLAGRVGTHTSKLEQLATSIKSLVKGESTYTDPDGKSATSGIYSLVTQTRDSVTALFGQYTKTADMQSQIATAKSQATAAANSATDSKLSSYTKTADLASTQAVKDAKKAGTDAQAAASAAQSTADTAKADAATAKTNAASAVSTANNAKSTADSASTSASKAVTTANTASSNASSAVSTANAAKTSAASAVSTANAASSTASSAKSTADSLATMIREDATGITVGKSADGKTYSTGRTRMTADAFEVLSKAGEVLSSFGKDKVRLGVGSSTSEIDMADGHGKIFGYLDPQIADPGDGITELRISSDKFLTLHGANEALLCATPSSTVVEHQNSSHAVINVSSEIDGHTFSSDVRLEATAVDETDSDYKTKSTITMLASDGATLNGAQILTAPTVLFYNEAQAIDTSIPLSDSAGNYTRLKIFYKSDNEDYSSVDVYNPDGKTVALQIARPAYAYAQGAAPVMYVKSKIVKISGATIDTVQVNTYGGGSNYLRMQKNLSGGYDASDKVGIIRVEGYKW